MGQTREGVVQLMYWSRARATRTGRVAATESMMAVDGLDALMKVLWCPNLVSPKRNMRGCGRRLKRIRKRHVKK